MRFVLLAALLASACDQGAKAAPPAPAPPVEARVDNFAPPHAMPPKYEKYEVKSDEDFADKAFGVIEELFGIFSQPGSGGTGDCEAIAVQVENFGERNATRFAVLTAYGKAHPGAEKLIQKRFEPRMNQLISKMTSVVSPCMSNQRMVKAFEKLAKDAQGFQQQQRPH